MLRPATPLTILLLAAFVLLLISVISVPIVRSIPLASNAGVDLGVFGYCKGSSCSKVAIGYNPSSLFDPSQADSFDLPGGTRATLSSILIVHPIAAFFTLILLVLAGTAHMHSPSHSPRYLLGVFIMSILTFLLALLSFLIDVLLFVPHMAWGSYIVLAATILIAFSGIVSCAMRRTLVSRKARKRRIAENAEMNGENYYARQAIEPTPPVAIAPVTNGSVGGTDKQPSFATFETSKTEGNDHTSDERIPLTSRTPTDRSPDGGFSGTIVLPSTDDRNGRPGGPSPMPMGPGGPNGRYNTPPPRDQYGNPLNRDAYGQGGMRGQDPRNFQSGPPGGYRGRGGGPPGGYRGRGGPGYYGQGRGGYGGPGGPAGYGPPGPNRGPGGMENGMMGAGAGMAGGMMRGGRGPPPGYSNGYGAPAGRGYPQREPSPGDGYGQYDGRSPGPGFSRSNTGGPVPGGQGGPAGYGSYNDDRRDSLPRAESPPPLPGMDEPPAGQAVEMDATTGSPSLAPKGFVGQYGPLRDSDGDVAGMVGLQQQRLAAHNSDGSKYSTEDYVPPRQNWNEGRSSPLNPTRQATDPSPAPVANAAHRRQNSGDNYYEDVDPRFAEPTPPPVTMPSALLPGNPGRLPPSTSNPSLNTTGLHGSASYEDLHNGSRSPAESDRSNFTSVSQRGVNPRWNPAVGSANPMPALNQRRGPPPQQRNEILLSSNPDFELPGPRGRGGGALRGGHLTPGGGQAGMVPRSAYE